MNIGVITYKEYDENVLLNAHFNIEQLYDIILNDEDFVRFEIFDRHKNLLVSTYYPNVKDKGHFIRPVKVVRKEEIKGVDYYAFRTPSTIFKKKIHWDVDGANFKTKKQAEEYANNVNNRVAREIERFVDRTTF